jgi:hypothetical protein
MSINATIQKFRAYPAKLSMKKEIGMAVCIIAIGIAMGLIAKMTDSVSIIGEIGTEIGIWVFAATLIAACSCYPFSAAINVFLFFISMLGSYYLYTYIVFGFFPTSYFTGWLIITLLSPFAGFIAWFTKAKGALGSVVTALPAALLFAHGYPAFYTLRLTLFLSLIMGVGLCAILPVNIKNKGISFVLAILLAIVVDKLYLLRFLPV